MVKESWGVKRVCQVCHTRFYDLKRTPPVCPKCHAAFDVEALYRTRRRAAQKEAVPVALEVLDETVVFEATDLATPADDVFIEDSDELSHEDDVVGPLEHEDSPERH